jgi:hypothetical protein
MKGLFAAVHESGIGPTGSCIGDSTTCHGKLRAARSNHHDPPPVQRPKTGHDGLNETKGTDNQHIESSLKVTDIRRFDICMTCGVVVIAHHYLERPDAAPHRFHQRLGLRLA